MWKSSLGGWASIALILVSSTLAQEYTFDQQSNSEPSEDPSVTASSARKIFNSERMVVNPGERLYLDCGVEGKYRSCIWEKGGDHQQTFQVEDVHAGYVSGMSKPESTKGNECGIVVNSVTPNDNGDWTCKIFVIANTLRGSKTVLVTVKPQPPTLKINESPLVMSENEERDIECTVAAARPAASIRWFIGTEDVTASSKTENIPTDDMETYRSISVLRHRFIHADDRKNLKCLIEHVTLHEPEYTEVPLDIRYKPYPISSTEIYGIPVDSEYEIKFNFTSNPVPEMKWYIAGDEVPVPGESGRYLANIKNLMDNIYMATLRIRDFSPEDVRRAYKLTARNDLGERTFNIALSTDPAPPHGGYDSSEIIATHEKVEPQATIGAGSLAAIIVIVLLILVLLFIIGMMRYRQMYCFGSKDKIKNHLKDSDQHLREEHDTESAHPEITTTTPAKTNKSKLFKNMNIKAFKIPIPTIPKRGQKEPGPEQMEEGGVPEVTIENGEEGGKTNPELVYAELELGKRDNNKSKKNDKSANLESTEYAEIVGTVPDNRMVEK